MTGEPWPMKGPASAWSRPRKEDVMSTIEAFIKRHPVLTYALTFAISWGGFVL